MLGISTIYLIVLLLIVYTIGLWHDLMFRKIKNELWIFVVLVLLGITISLQRITFFQVILFLILCSLLITLTLADYLGGADFKGLFIFYFYYVFLGPISTIQTLFSVGSSYSNNFLTSVFLGYLSVELSYFGVFIISNLLLLLVSKKRINQEPPFFFGLLILLVFSLL